MKVLVLILGGLVVIFIFSAVGSDGNSSISMMNQARSYLKANMSEEAISLLDTVVQNSPSTEALCLKGKALMKLGKYEDALKIYEFAILRDRTNYEALSGKCEALSALNECDKVAHCYDDVVYNYPTPDANNLAGNALISTSCPVTYHGNMLSKSEIYDKALEFYNKSISIDENYYSAWNNKGVALGELGRLNESIECFDKAITINFSFGEAWNNKGVSLDKMQRHQEALESYEKAINIDPKMAEAWYNMAINLEGNSTTYVAAEECYSKAIEINRELKEIEIQTQLYKRTS